MKLEQISWSHDRSDSWQHSQRKTTTDASFNFCGNNKENWWTQSLSITTSTHSFHVLVQLMATFTSDKVQEGTWRW